MFERINQSEAIKRNNHNTFNKQSLLDFYSILRDARDAGLQSHAALYGALSESEFTEHKTFRLLKTQLQSINCIKSMKKQEQAQH